MGAFDQVLRGIVAVRAPRAEKLEQAHAAYELEIGEGTRIAVEVGINDVGELPAANPTNLVGRIGQDRLLVAHGGPGLVPGVARPEVTGQAAAGL